MKISGLFLGFVFEGRVMVVVLAGLVGGGCRLLLFDAYGGGLVGDVEVVNLEGLDEASGKCCKSTVFY